MRLRYAEPGDIPECVQIGEDFWEKSPYKDHMEYSPEGVDLLLGKLVHKQYMYIAEHEDEIVGVAGIMVAPMPFDPRIRIASELFWYVKPGARDLGIGDALLAAMEAGAKGAGASMFSMGTMQSSNPEDAERMLYRADYKHTEQTFTKVL